MGKYIIGIDQSTQGTKVILFDENGQIVLRVNRNHRQIVNEQGWVEHDPEEIWQNLLGLVKELLDKSAVDPMQLVGVGITNQRETVAVWDRTTGRPAYNAIVWQCTRGEGLCSRLAEAHPEAVETVRKKTGLRLSPYFSAAKWGWLMENVPELHAKSQEGDLCFGTMDSYLVYRLTDGASFLTDYSNASRTQLFDIHHLAWDAQLCEYFGVPMPCLPDLMDSDGCYGETDFAGLLPKKIPIHSVMGDSHAALFGQGCLERGMVKATYGTGSSIMMNIGAEPIMSENGLVTSLAWKIGGRVQYVLEGNINYTGAVITWLKDDLHLIEGAGETEVLARAANPADRTILVPAFSGLGAPYWDSNARAAIVGMSRTTGRNEIVRAALDCIANQITDVVDLMRKESGISEVELRADGGPTRNGYLMQLQADFIGSTVRVPEAEELSCIGVAWAAGLALGIYTDRIFDSLTARTVTAVMDCGARAEHLAAWSAAVQSVRRS